jgi:hypothetical protein
VNGVAAWLFFGAPFCVVFYGDGRPNCYVPPQHIPSIIQATVLAVLDLSSLLCLLTLLMTLCILSCSTHMESPARTQILLALPLQLWMG